MALNVASLVLILFSVVIIVLGIVKIHEYPSKVAEARNHPQQQAILVCSILGLLVFPLWMFALLWAYGGTIGTPLPPVPAEEPPPPPDAPAAASKA
jgi:uncharacterized membrane protein YidH (DUF202 family)